MKKFFILVMAVALLAGCSRISQLEDRVAKLEKRGVMELATGAGANFYPARGIDGGVAGDLDKITGMVAGDVGFVVLNKDASYGNAVFVYVYTDYGDAVSEALPYEVKPDTGASANYAWSLAFSSVAVPVVATGNITLTLGQARAGMVKISAAGTVTLPGAATIGFGSMICVWVEDASETVTIGSATAGDIINLHGTALAAGNVIDSPGNAGDYICLVSDTDADGGGTDGWVTMGYGEEAWTDGGAS